MRKRPVGQMSGGQRAKVILAKPLPEKPDVLLREDYICAFIFSLASTTKPLAAEALQCSIATSRSQYDLLGIAIVLTSCSKKGG